MDTTGLESLLQADRDAPPEYRATSYWAAYEERLLAAVRGLDVEELRSGKYPILAAFGFNDVTYAPAPYAPAWKKFLIGFLHRHVLKERAILPYAGSLGTLRELAYRHCELVGQVAGAAPLASLESSRFGRPADLFEIGGKKVTLAFLNYYLRYAFAHAAIGFGGGETVVELGSGSGYQIAVLKKLYPRMTVLCFDLPVQLFLCETYLRRALAGVELVGAAETRPWRDLRGVKPGAVHFFGSWQFPLLAGRAFDVFWNAASFGEMEPGVVANYLRHVTGQARWIYLLQARHGKETANPGAIRVTEPVTLATYERLLAGYARRAEHDAWLADQPMRLSGGYFEAVWERLASARGE